MKKSIIITMMILSGIMIINYNKEKNILMSENKLAFTINDENYLKEESHDININIKYPQIRYSEDLFKEKKVNELIKSDILNVMKSYKEREKKISLEIEYFIKLNKNNLLSIQYDGVGYEEDGLYPHNHFFTTNIDLKKEIKLKLKDIVTIDEKFIENLKEKSVCPIKDQENSILLKINYEELKNELLIADMAMDEFISEYNGPYSYITESGIGISIPVIHAIGDHAEFEIEFDYIRENIKDEYKFLIEN